MAEKKIFPKIIIVLIVIAVILCFLGVGFADKLTERLGGDGVTMAYESRLFDTDEPIRINIIMDEEDWNDMLADATSELFVPCDVEINGDRICNVGIRPKGNTSLSAIAMDPTTNRFSLKLEFDQYMKGQNCYGLDKLILNNNFADATNMKEALIYDMFQFMGAEAPLYNYAEVYVNGEYWGVYLALEAVEDSFLLRNFGTQAGEMYKPDTMDMDMGDDEGSFDAPDPGGFEEGDSSGEEGGSGGGPGGESGGDSGGESGGGPGGESGGDSGNAGQEAAEEAVETESADTAKAAEETETEEAVPSAEDTTDQGGPSGNNDGESSGDSDGESSGDSDGEPSGDRDGESSGEGGDFDPENMPDMGDFPGPGGMSGGANLNYIDDDLDSYSEIWNAEITGTSDADHRRVVTALKNISEGNDLETYMDIDNLLRYTAVHVFAVNEDSLSGNMSHNYYLYEYNGQLNMFPWDYNLSLGGMGGLGGGPGGADQDGAASLINDPIDTPFSGTNFFDTLLEDETYLEQYHTYLRQLVEEYINGGGFDEFYKRTRSQIDSLVESDPSAFYSYEEYQKAADMLYKTVKLRGESIEGQLNGTIPSTEAGQRADSSALIDASEIDIETMGTFNMGGGFEGFGDNTDFENGAEQTEAAGDGETAGAGDSFGGSFGGFPGGEAGGFGEGFGGFPGMSGQSVEETRNRNLITIGICLGVILLCTAGILLFVRRKYYHK